MGKISGFAVTLPLLLCVFDTNAACCPDPFSTVCEPTLTKIAKNCSQLLYYNCSEVWTLCFEQTETGARARRQCPVTCGTCPKLTDSEICLDTCHRFESPFSEDSRPDDCTSKTRASPCDDYYGRGICAYGLDCTDCGPRPMTKLPTKAPTSIPTESPSRSPTAPTTIATPSETPTSAPTSIPSKLLTTSLPSTMPTIAPSNVTGSESKTPTFTPSKPESLDENDGVGHIIGLLFGVAFTLAILVFGIPKMFPQFLRTTRKEIPREKADEEVEIGVMNSLDEEDCNSNEDELPAAPAPTTSSSRALLMNNFSMKGVSKSFSVKNLSRKNLPKLHLQKEERWNFFLSHYQANGFGACELLRQLLISCHLTCWLDQASKKMLTEMEMLKSVENSEMYVLILSQGVMSRQMVQKELMRAVDLDKPMIAILLPGFNFETEETVIPQHLKEIWRVLLSQSPIEFSPRRRTMALPPHKNHSKDNEIVAALRLRLKNKAKYKYSVLKISLESSNHSS